MADRNSSRRLTHTAVKSIAQPGRYGDGRGGLGLSLLVKKTANRRWSKTWSQRIRINGKLVTRGLGSFPVVTLAMARETALDNARRVAQGEDILKPAPIIPTVAQAFEAVIGQRSRSWRGICTERSWRRSLGFSKKIASKPVSEVTATDILDVITPLWYDKPKTAREVRSNLATVMEWAKTKEYRNTNPAAPGVTSGLGKQPPVVGRKSLVYRLLGSSLATVRDSDAWWAAKYCLLFIAFTCVRSGEAREATWDEINLATATWTIPATRMKNGIEHKVPLSTQAKDLLAYARNQSNGSQETIFPPQRGGQYMDDGRLSRLLTRLKIPAVPHGARSSFINWAGGRPLIAQPASEMVLAHTPSEAVVRAYRTSDFFEHRQPIMQEWGDFLTETMGPVISTMPTQTEVRTVAQRIKAENLRVQTCMVDPITAAEYELIVQTAQQSEPQGAPQQVTLPGAVDVAVIGLMRDALLMTNQAAAARWCDLQREEDGSGRLINIRSSRTDGSGMDHVAYVSAGTMAALDEMWNIQRELGMDATDNRLFQMGSDQLRQRIKKTCEAAGLEGNYSAYSPRNGMVQDLSRSGVSRIDLMQAKRWKILAKADHSERHSIATHGAVAQWCARKQKEAASR